MAAHNWGIERLRQNKLDQHILLLVEDWNEPDSYEVSESAILCAGAAIIVSSQVQMLWSGADDTIGSEILTIVVGTYVGDTLQSTTLIDNNDAHILYAPDAP